VTKEELIEQLADKQHAHEACWMQYLFSSCDPNPDGSLTIPCGLVDRWQKQIDTSYSDLSERKKRADRDEVAHILSIIEAYKIQSLTKEERQPIL